MTEKDLRRRVYLIIKFLFLETSVAFFFISVQPRWCHVMPRILRFMLRYNQPKLVREKSFPTEKYSIQEKHVNIPKQIFFENI